MTTPITDLSVTVRHRDLDPTMIDIDHVPLMLLLEALASKGIGIRGNRLVMVSEDWKIDIGDDGEQVGRCPKCESVEVTASQRHAELGLYGHMVCQVCGHTSEAKS